MLLSFATCDEDDETLFIHGILSLQSGILKSRALYNILIRSTNYALMH